MGSTNPQNHLLGYNIGSLLSDPALFGAVSTTFYYYLILIGPSDASEILASSSSGGGGVLEPTQSNFNVASTPYLYPQMESTDLQNLQLGHDIGASSYHPEFFGAVSTILCYYLILISPTDTSDIFVSSLPWLGDDPSQVEDQFDTGLDNSWFTSYND